MTQDAANALLTGPRLPAGDAAEQLPDVPGLYAVYATAAAKMQLGLIHPVESHPIYVGKAEDSLRRRDGRTHFKVGKTGQSTLRRAIAALLKEPLQLKARPRNPAKPSYFDKFGLEPDSDCALQEWMDRHLGIAVWTAPARMRLVDIEKPLIVMWTPPLNDTHNPKRWQHLRDMRKVMATEAERWRPG